MREKGMSAVTANGEFLWDVPYWDTKLLWLHATLYLQVFNAVFTKFNWSDVSLIMDRDDVHGNIVGETLDVGLQKGGIFPHVIKYYGDVEKDVSHILEEASQKSRGE